MNVAYVTTYNGEDIRNWSGTAYHISQALKKQSIFVQYIGSLHNKYSWFSTARKYLYRAATGQRFLPDRDPRLLKDYARQVEARLAGLRVNVVFSPSTLPIAYLECRQPIVFWTDATFAGMIDFYADLTNVHKRSFADGMAVEKAALDRATLAIYSSDWAARSAIEHYGTDPAKVKVLPFGANLEPLWTEPQIRSAIEERGVDKCRLIFMAVDWVRKRGDLAIEVTRQLNLRGLPADLTVLGCQPRRRETEPFVRWAGFVSKSTTEGRERISSLLRQSHFLLLPSIADCTPIVFNEANALGIPCLSTSVGGIPSVIRDDINGKLFPLNAEPEAYAHYIHSVMAKSDRYRQLALSSLNEYKVRLNWATTGRKLKELLEMIPNSADL